MKKAKGEKLRRKKAFTLMELVICFILIFVLIGAIWIVYNTGFQVFFSQTARSTAKGETGRVFANMASELRQATSLTSVTQTSITFTLDSDNSGSDETLQYSWSELAGDPLNRTFSLGSTVPIVRSVSALSFSYYDSNNNLLSFPVTASQVKSISIVLTVTDKEETFQLRSNIKLRTL